MPDPRYSGGVLAGIRSGAAGAWPDEIPGMGVKVRGELRNCEVCLRKRAASGDPQFATDGGWVTYGGVALRQRHAVAAARAAKEQVSSDHCQREFNAPAPREGAGASSESDGDQRRAAAPTTGVSSPSSWARTPDTGTHAHRRRSPETYPLNTQPKPEQEIEPMNVDSDFLCQTLKVDDLPAGKIVVVEIADCVMRTLKDEKGKEEQKPVLSFARASKVLVLNKVNARAIRDLLKTPDTDHWRGQKIGLYVDPNVDFGGRRVKGIRICAATGRPAAAAPAPPPPPAQELNDNVSDGAAEEVPF